MAEAAIATMGEAEFFAWQDRQDVLYELVGGWPVPKSMTGATRRHDLVVVNAIAAFRQKLRGGPCRPHTDDLALRTAVNLRRPDMTIDCGSADPLGLTAHRPILVLEVLSPSTAELDQIIKLEEYKALPSLRYILIADPATPRVLLYSRGTGELWSSMSHIGAESVLGFPDLGCTLTLAELYEDVPDAAPPNASAT